MNVLMLVPIQNSRVALRGVVTTQMGVTGAHVKMDTPIMDRKGPRVQVSSLHPYRISDYSLIGESIAASHSAHFDSSRGSARLSTQQQFGASWKSCWLKSLKNIHIFLQLIQLSMF